jgi:hypothetical protein
MDNLSSHKGPRIRQMIEATGAGLRYLPPYSPDFNPIEIAFAKLKALPRKVADRTVNGLWAAIGRIIDLFPPAECANYFSAGGYDATRSDSALDLRGSARPSGMPRGPDGVVSYFVRRVSVGVTNMLTRNTAATPENLAARPRRPAARPQQCPFTRLQGRDRR